MYSLGARRRRLLYTSLCSVFGLRSWMCCRCIRVCGFCRVFIRSALFIHPIFVSAVHPKPFEVVRYGNDLTYFYKEKQRGPSSFNAYSILMHVLIRFRVISGDRKRSLELHIRETGAGSHALGLLSLRNIMAPTRWNTSQLPRLLTTSQSLHTCRRPLYNVFLAH